MEYYKKYLVRYMLADAETRNAAKKHWIKCHKDNMKSGREDMIIFSAKMLASITLAEDLMKGVKTA